MAATLKGRGVVWSVGSITMTAGIVSASNADFVQSARSSRTSEKAEIKDDAGTIRAQVFHGFKKTLSLTVIPCSLSGTNTVANAQSSMDAHMPAVGTTITVVDGAGTIIDGNYNLISSTQNRSVDGPATLDLELENGDEGVDLTAAVT